MKTEDKSSKPDYTLLPIEGLNRWAERRQFGVRKYGGRDDWQTELAESGVERYEQSLLRHVMQYIHGDRSEDHLGAILCNTGFICWYEEHKDTARPLSLEAHIADYQAHRVTQDGQSYVHTLAA